MGLCRREEMYEVEVSLGNQNRYGDIACIDLKL